MTAVVKYPAQPIDQKSIGAQDRRKRLLAFASPLALVLLWELLARLGAIDVRFFPAPTVILVAFFDMAQSGELWRHVSVSIVRVLIGFLLGAVPGLVLGLAMGLSPLLRTALQPIVDALYPIPKIAVLPLVLMIFGLGEMTKYVIIAVGVFFVVAINTTAGVVNIDRIYLDVGRNYGATRLAFSRTIALPGALPMIFAGLKLGMGVSFLLIVAAEFVGAQAGVGYMIWNSWQVFFIEQLYVGLGLISVLGVLFSALVDWVERLVVPWKR